IQGRTNKGTIDQPITTHQTVQMEAFSDIILKGTVPEVPVDGEEAVRDLKIIDAIYAAVQSGKKVELKG
ncbi:MAG: gfo/Idh/MocA family oxidoreductase, partial [Chitinophaga rupis]